MVMDVLERAQELEALGQEIIHLEIGEPDFDTPKCVKQAACQALERGQTHYTHSLGILPLREAICAHYQQKYKVHIEPDQIIVTSGTSPAMLLCFASLLEQGEEVIVSDPGYACYANFVNFVGGTVKAVKVDEEDGFQFSIQRTKEACTPKTKAILINSPANPTGTLLSSKRLQELTDLDPYIVSDEIYHGLVYQGQAHSILEFTDRAFVLNGFSKLYAMTGWRLGYLICPQNFIRDIQKLSQNLFICAGSVDQWAGIAALTQAQQDVQEMKRIYDERRRYMLPRLKEMGFGLATEPTGAFYVLANAKKFCTDSHQFAFELLEKAHVGVAPGIDFGPNGEGFIRFSYANSLENIKKGLDYIQTYLEQSGLL